MLVKIKISLVLLFITCKAFASPVWYHNLSNTQANYYIGYAQATSEAEAKKLALRDIASQISVRIDSRYSKEIKLHNQNGDKKIVDNTTIESHAKLRGYEMLELTFEKGRYFVALGYENISSIDKLNRALTNMKLSEPELQNRYLAQTPMARALLQKVNFSLVRNDGNFYIQYKNSFTPLNSQEFSYFFATIDNSILSISTSNNRNTLYEGDEFYFKVTSEKDGYVSIFNVYEDGTVASLMRNISIKAHKEELIPDKMYESILQAGLIHEGKATFDLYVVVYSSKKEHYDLFANADDRLILDERYKNFDALIDMLNEVEFASIKIVTKPR